MLETWLETQQRPQLVPQDASRYIGLTRETSGFLSYMRARLECTVQLRRERPPAEHTAAHWMRACLHAANTNAIGKPGSWHARAHNYSTDTEAFVPQPADVRRICILFAIDYVAFRLPPPATCADLFLQPSTSSFHRTKMSNEHKVVAQN